MLICGVFDAVYVKGSMTFVVHLFKEHNMLMKYNCNSHIPQG